MWQPCELLYTCYLLTYLLTAIRSVTHCHHCGHLCAQGTATATVILSEEFYWTYIRRIGQVFTAIFTAEAVLKVLALGLYTYLRDLFTAPVGGAQGPGARSLHLPARSLELFRHRHRRSEPRRAGTRQRQGTVHPPVIPPGRLHALSCL